MAEEKLSPDELRRIYEERILPAFRSVMVAQEQPRAFFIGGQPGAGKSYARADIARELHGQAVILDPDRLREQDPRYRELEKTDPQRAMEVGNPSANAWTIMLRNDAIAARANVIYETVMRDPKSFAWIVDKMAQTHRVELDVVATRPEVATGRVLLRREDTITTNGSARVVPPEVIRSAESGMLDALRQAEEKGQIARIHVRDQFGKTLYEAQAPYPPGGQAAATIERDRQRPLSAAENETLREDWAKTLDQMAARRIDPQERRELTTYGPLPATVREAIADRSLTQAPASQALATQILADNDRSHPAPLVQQQGQQQQVQEQQAQLATSAAPSIDQTSKVRLGDREHTVSFDPSRRGQEVVLRLHDAATGEPGARISADAPRHTPTAGNVMVENYGKNVGLAEALARSGAFTKEREVMSGMFVEMKVLDPVLRAELQKREVTRAHGHEQTKGRDR